MTSLILSALARTLALITLLLSAAMCTEPTEAIAASISHDAVAPGCTARV